jgi:hypothetical protein
MQKMNVNISRGMGLFILIGSLLSVAAGIFGLITGGDLTKVGMALAVLYFGPMAVLAGRELMDGRPCIVIYQRGIYKRLQGEMIIEWNDIQGASLRKISIWFGGGYYINLKVKQPQKYLQRLPWHWRALAFLNRPLGISPVSIPLAVADVNVDDLLEVIRQNIEEHKKQHSAA